MPPSINSPGEPRKGKRQLVAGRKAKGMRQWLEDLLDSEACHGLQWKDKAQNIFTIVWRHASSHGFDRSKHADVFNRWDEYRGRAAKSSKPRKQGNYNSTLKSNFRCALRSLIDCIELKDQNSREAIPKKTFQFIPSYHPMYKVRLDKKRGTYKKKNVAKVDERTCSADANKPVTEDQGTVVTSTIQLPQHDQTKEEAMLYVESGIVKEEKSFPETTVERLQSLPGQSSQFSMHCEIGPNGYPSITLFPKEKLNIIKKDIEDPIETKSSLPDFAALGVKDEYGPKSYTNSKMLACGGMVSVRKMKSEETEIPETIEVFLPTPSQTNSENTVANLNPSGGETLLFYDLPSIQDVGGNLLLSQVELPSPLSSNGFFRDTESGLSEARVITESVSILNNAELFPFESEEFQTSFCDSF